jgi:hypothetical protein
MAFNPSVPQRTYSVQEWKLKEDWYVAETGKLQFTVSPTPAEIQQIALSIDNLLSVARIDYAYINQTYDKYNMQRKIEETRQFVALKQQPPQQFANMKLTVDEMKGVVATVIKQTPWDGTSLSLYDLVQLFSSRYIFMEGVIKLLQDKKDLLITHNGILKIESSLGAMQPSVPTAGKQTYGGQPYPDDYHDSRESV